MGRRNVLTRRLVVLGLTFSGVAAAAGAQRDERVFIRINDCVRPQLEHTRVCEAMTLELEGAGVAEVLTAPRAPSVTTTDIDVSVEVHCPDGAGARIVARPIASDATFARDVPLEDVVAADRPRVLALAAGELLDSLRAALVYPGGAGPPTEPSHASTSSAAPEAAKPRGGAPAAGSPNVSAARRSTKSRDKNRKASAAASRDAAVRTPPFTAEPYTLNPTVDRVATADGLAPESGLSASELQWLVQARLRAFPHYETVLLGAAGGLQLDRASVGVEALFGGSRSDLGDISVGDAAIFVAYELVSIRTRSMFGAMAAAVAGGVTWATGSPRMDTYPEPVVSTAVVDVYADARLNLTVGFLTKGGGAGMLTIEGGRAAGLVASSPDYATAATGGWFIGGSLGARF